MANFPSSPPPGSVPGMSPGDMEALSDSSQAQAQLSQAQGGLPASSPKPARTIGSLPQEGTYLAQDIGQGVIGLLPDFMQEILGIKETDTPEEKSKKQQMLQNYQKLNAEDQAFVQKKMQREQAEKQQRDEEEQMKRQQSEASQGDDISMPTGKVTGEAAAGASNKQRTTQKLQSDRKKLSSAG